MDVISDMSPRDAAAAAPAAVAIGSGYRVVLHPESRTSTIEAPKGAAT